MFPVVWHVHFFFLSCFVCRSASVGCKALIWFSCSEWELTNHWHCHLLDMSQPSSPHSQHSFHCSTEAQHWWLKASPFWSGEYLHCIFCFHISVLLNFRSSSLLPHILTVLSVFYSLSARETNCQWRFCGLCLWQMYKVSQTFDLVWWDDILQKFCNTLVQAWVTICSAMFNSSTSLCYAAASILFTLALWQTFIFVIVYSVSHMSTRTGGSFVPFASPQSSFLTHFVLSKCWHISFQFLFLWLSQWQSAVLFFWRSVSDRCCMCCLLKCPFSCLVQFKCEERCCEVAIYISQWLYHNSSSLFLPSQAPSSARSRFSSLSAIV